MKQQTKTTAGDWKKRAAAAMTEKRGKYLSAELRQRVERNICKRVPRGEVRAWMAQQIDDKNYKMKKESNIVKRLKQTGQDEADLKSKNARESTKQRQNGGPKALLHDIQRRIRKWITKRAAGEGKNAAQTTPRMTNPMVRQMERGLAKGPRTSQGVRAALAIMAAQEEVKVEWKIMTAANTQVQWKTEVLQTVTEEKWMTKKEAQEMIAKADKSVTELGQHREVAFDIGQGMEGLKEGVARVMPVYGTDMVRQYKGKKEGMATPDMMHVVKEGEDDLIQKISKMAGVTQQEVPYVHFSLDCSTNSKFQYMEATQGRGKGVHAEKDRLDDGAVTAMVRSILKQQHRTQGKQAFTVEQPAGSAMATHPLMKALGEPILTHQCCYGYKHCKPSWIWTNLFPRYWKPRPFAKGKCRHCKHCNEGTQHEERMMRRGKHDRDFKPPTREGFTKKAMRNRIAPDLGEILAKAAVRKWRE